MVRGKAIARRLERPEDDLALIRAAQLLAEAGWIDVEFDEDDTPGRATDRAWRDGDPRMARRRQ